MTNSREMTGHSNTLKMDESEDRDSRIGDGMDVTITGNNGSVLHTKDSWGTISQVPQPILRNGLGERSPPERVIFLQRLLAP